MYDQSDKMKTIEGQYQYSISFSIEYSEYESAMYIGYWFVDNTKNAHRLSIVIYLRRFFI